MPLVESPGYSLKINFTDSTFFFQAETVQWPVTIENCCDGDCTTTDFTYGNGGINSFFQTLPATGYALKGSYDAQLLIGAGTLTATVTWDIQAKEIAPASTCPLSNTINNQTQLEILRSLRDSMVAHEAGSLITMLYYQHASETAAILLQNPHLQQEVRELVGRHSGLVEQLLSDGGASLSDAVIKDIVCFLDDLKAYASPALQDSIDLLLEKIKDGSLGKELGITL